MIKIKFSKKTWKYLSLVLALILLINLSFNLLTFINKDKEKGKVTIVKSVSAKEIYPLFDCPCDCGQDLLECNCSYTKEPQDLIQNLIAKNETKEEIILSYIKKYGVNSIRNDQMKEKYQQILEKQFPEEERSKITVSPQSYDLGNVSVNDDVVNASFKIKNEGKNKLIINKIETSCGCTSASLLYNGQKSPKFNTAQSEVNQQNQNWSLEIPARGEATLIVYYDPAFNQDFRGTAIREVLIHSNDPIYPVKNVRIELNHTE